MNKRLSVNKKRGIAILLIFLFIGIIIFQSNLRPFYIGYLSGTQGLEATFNSIYWKNYWWSSTERPTSAQVKLDSESTVDRAAMSFGYSMAFDPDGSGAFLSMAILCGSQQPMTIQTDVEPKQYAWQYKVGSTTFPNGTIVDEYKQFEMYRYKCDWAINIWLSGLETESYYSYTNLELWLHLSPRAFVYFLENPNVVYFAPAYIGLAENVEWAGTTQDGTKIINDASIQQAEDLIPKVKGETLGIYYQRGGGDVLTENDLLKYQGTTLDPELFRKEYWMRINLLNFQPVSWHTWFTHNWKFPSAHLRFLVYMYVVGEWTVYFKTGEIPKLEPHTPMSYQYNPLGFIGEFFSNPFNLLLAGFFGILIVIVILAIFAPGVLGVVTAAVSRKKR